MLIDARVRAPWELHPIDLDAVAVPEGLAEGYDRVLGVDQQHGLRVSSLLADLDNAGVDHAVVHAECEFGDPADALNEAVAALVAEHPARLSGLGTVSLSPARPRRMLTQVARCHELGLNGLSIQPAFYGLAIDDRILYPVYARAEELGMVVALHTGVNYSLVTPIGGEHPIRLDQVACDFPDLALIAAHAAWPWATDLAAVMRRHPNVYAEFGGLSPRYVAKPGTGWDVLFHFLDNLLARQSLFGTDWPVFPIDRAAAEWRAAGLKPASLDALLGGNAARLFGIAAA